MRWRPFLVPVFFALVWACVEARSHAELMADAVADVEAVRLERAMERFDSARTLLPEDAEAHRQYARLASFYDLYPDAIEAWERAIALEPVNCAAWDGYVQVLSMANRFEKDRRYGEKLLRILPDAIRTATRRPRIYTNAMRAAEHLGELAGYRAILLEKHSERPDDHVVRHHLGAVRLTLADLTAGSEGRAVRDSLGAALDELAGQGSESVDASILYRLAAGYDLLQREEEKDLWLERLEAAPDLGVLADELRLTDRMNEFQAALFQEESSRAVEEALRLAEDGLETRDLIGRAVWQVQLYMANDERARRFAASSPAMVSGNDAEAAEPPGPPLPPDLADPLFASATEVLRWQLHGTQVMALESLIRYGIRPEAVLEQAAEVEAALRANRPGYLFPGYQGDQREAERRRIIDETRVLQARALTQLGRTEAAEELFEELATESAGGRTLGEFGRHLLRAGRPAEALAVLVRAVAYGGSRYRSVAESAAASAGLPVDVVDERLAVQRPLVQAERERKALGERLGLAAPELALPDQHGVEWRLGDLAGRVVVLKFWATWCGPCLAEFPHFVKLLEKYEDDDEVVFLTVASAGSAPEGVNEILTENGYTFPVLIDTRGSALDFEILGYPTTIYLDPEGLIQFRRIGFDENDYERQTSIRIDALRRVHTEDSSP